jgi:hypothetical protein
MWATASPAEASLHALAAHLTVSTPPPPPLLLPLLPRLPLLLQLCALSPCYT